MDTNGKAQVSFDSFKVLLRCLKEEDNGCGLKPEEALEILKSVSRQDFGYDDVAWKNWMQAIEMQEAETRRRKQNN